MLHLEPICSGLRETLNIRLETHFYNLKEVISAVFCRDPLLLWILETFYIFKQQSNVRLIEAELNIF